MCENHKQWKRLRQIRGVGRTSQGLDSSRCHSLYRYFAMQPHADLTELVYHVQSQPAIYREQKTSPTTKLVDRRRNHSRYP